MLCQIRVLCVSHVSIRQHTCIPSLRASSRAADLPISIRQHTSAYVSIRQHTCIPSLRASSRAADHWFCSLARLRLGGPLSSSSAAWKKKNRHWIPTMHPACAARDISSRCLLLLRHENFVYFIHVYFFNYTARCFLCCGIANVFFFNL
jgi:hypothetical protein